MRKLTIIACIIGAIMAAISILPMRFAAAMLMPGDAAINLNYGGTVWQGYAALPDYQGYVDIQMNGLSAIKRGAPVHFETRGTPFVASGDIGLTGAVDVRIDAPLEALVMRDARLHGLSGQAVIALRHFDPRSPCSAEGQVTVRDIAMNYPNWAWQGPALSGPVLCENDRLKFKLAGQDGGDDITLNLDLKKGANLSGGYNVDLSFSTQQDGASIALPLLGFDNKDGRWQLTERGTWP